MGHARFFSILDYDLVDRKTRFFWQIIVRIRSNQLCFIIMATSFDKRKPIGLETGLKRFYRRQVAFLIKLIKTVIYVYTWHFMKFEIRDIKMATAMQGCKLGHTIWSK